MVQPRFKAWKLICDYLFLNSCHYPGCENSSQRATLVCSRCHQCYYCSGEHQRLDWKQHKPYCSAVDEITRNRWLQGDLEKLGKAIDDYVLGLAQDTANTLNMQRKLLFQQSCALELSFFVFVLFRR
jgi:hypothetical protein